MRTSKYPNVTRGMEEAVYNRLGGEQGIEDFLAGKIIAVRKDTLKTLPLFEPIGPHNLPAIPKFVTAEKFRPGETIDGIKIAWLGDNFKKQYLPLTEDPIGATEILESNLLRAANELPQSPEEPGIIAELGGTKVAVSRMGQFWEILKTADQSLWYAIFAYDIENVLGVVNADWYSDGLCVNAYPLGDRYDFGAGSRFLSRGLLGK